MSEKYPDLQPMVEWVEEKDKDGVCRPCLLGPVLQWYRDTLREKEQWQMALKLARLMKRKDVTPLQLCQELDTIKNQVEAPLKERLEDFDCAVQTYEPDDS